MNATVFVALADVQAYGAAVDAAIGYPRDGVDMGAGPHVAKSASRTTQYSAPIKHPTLSLWAYPIDPQVQTVAARVALPVPISATVQTLDATWFPLAGAIAVGEATPE